MASETLGRAQALWPVLRGSLGRSQTRRLLETGDTYAEGVIEGEMRVSFHSSRT